MYEVKIEDPVAKIASLVWIGDVNLQEVKEVNQFLLDTQRKFQKDWRLLVDTSQFNLMNPEVQTAIVEQQKLVIDTISYVAVVIGTSAIRKMQLSRTAKASGNNKESFHATYAEALAHLKSLK